MANNSVLIITDRLRFIGGAETYIEGFASIFKKHHYKVDCLTYFQDFNIEADSDINMLSFRHNNLNLFGFNIARFFSFIKKLFLLSKNERYERIFLHLYIAPFILILFNLFPKIDKYVVVHGIRYLEIQSAVALPEKSNLFVKLNRLIKYGPEIIIYKFIQNYVLQRSHKIIVLSSYAKLQLLSNFKIPSENIDIIPGAIDHQIFKATSFNQKKVIKEQLGFSKDHQLIVLISRIEPRKNILAAIQAMSIIVEEFNKSILLIISPAQDAYSQSYLADCYAKVASNNLGNHVVFTTGIDNKAAVKYYQSADLALTISKDLETFGYTLIEALACGVPVIGTNVGNIPHILSKIDKNLITKPNYKDIASTVIRLLKLSKNEKLKLSKQCSEEIKRNNNYELFMYNHQKLFANEK